MPTNHEKLDEARLAAHGRAIGRWENEGGSFNGLHDQQAATVAGEVGDAETVNMRVRLIALENLVVALLSEAPDSQSVLVREMAEYISPRSSAKPHRLTVEAARNMIALVDRAAHYKAISRKHLR